VRPVQSGPAIGLLFQLLVLSACAATVGLSDLGWVVGVTVGLVGNLTLASALAARGSTRLGPANRVTVVRAALVGGVAALVADSFSRPAEVTLLVTISVAALVLDGVDGWVARRTSSASELGARFDMEVDAFLILVLSVHVAGSAGAWVLAIGAARYVFVLARWLLPWLQATAPPRFWGKVVAAVQGMALTLVATDLLSPSWADVVLAAALVLLAESFGHEVWWLWRHRRLAPLRGFAWARLATVLAGLLVFAVLVAPNETRLLTPATFVRIPVEALVVAALVLVLPNRSRRVVAALAGMSLAVVGIVKVLDMGFFMAFGRPVNPMVDWTYLGSGIDLLTDSVGRSRTILLLVAAGALAVGVLVLVPVAVLRLTRVVERHRTLSFQAVVTLGLVWVLSAALGLQLRPGAPVAAASAAGVAVDQVSLVRSSIIHRREFAEDAQVDAFRDTPGTDLLTGLRGKDVVVVFVESYGRVTLDDELVAARLLTVLDAGTRRLGAAGFSARTGFLTSPTFGGLSWLAHSTLQSGLWVDNELLYQDLVAGDRFTLSAAFGRAGWRTVADVPSNIRDWPEGESFYGYDKVYDSRNVGYEGPDFSYAKMPDQYVLSAFQRLELGRVDRPPLMAEIDLVSSHTPWAPLPRMVAWGDVGDGSVFDGMPGEGDSPEDVWRDVDRVKAAYAESVEYSLEALVSFVETYADDDLVLVVLGDHQPAEVVAGSRASRDVPVSVIAHDPAVLDRISGWGWTSGLRPSEDAPVWPMDEFRDRFLTAYGRTE
jgi:phosphatidylglycerophosphate synthase